MASCQYTIADEPFYLFRVEEHPGPTTALGQKGSTGFPACFWISVYKLEACHTFDISRSTVFVRRSRCDSVPVAVGTLLEHYRVESDKWP